MKRADRDALAGCGCVVVLLGLWAVLFGFGQAIGAAVIDGLLR